MRGAAAIVMLALCVLSVWSIIQPELFTSSRRADLPQFDWGWQAKGPRPAATVAKSPGPVTLVGIPVSSVAIGQVVGVVLILTTLSYILWKRL